MPPGARPASGNLSFDVLAEVAAGTTARIELCRVRAPIERAGALVAVKRLHKHIAEDREFADMFFDEVWMTAALHHPNVVDVAGWGNDRGGTYLAVELVQGVSLARLMKTVFETGEMFSERMVVFIGSSLCAGLAAAHDLRGQDGELLHLIHRDLTPGNVLIGFNGQVKITDFGLAKAKQRVTKTLTGMLKGHPQYMAPEMTLGNDIDHRADLFSLGVALFELFSGQPPWTGKNEVDLIRVTATEPPKDLMSLRPRLDRELANIVARLLERDPVARFQRADEVRARLLAWLDTHGYAAGNEEALARFVRRNAMRQMRWFERAINGELASEPATASKNERKPAGGLASAAPAPRVDRVRPTPIPPRLRRNRRVQDDSADITDLSADAPDDLMIDTTRDRGIDWGEEIPTVVKKTQPATFKVADEDSDGRTTQQKNAPVVAAPGGSATLVDPPSDEIPTVPVSRQRAAEAIARLASQPDLAAPPVAGPSAVLDLSVESERMSKEAVRLREEAESAAANAAHRALLAKLATDAATLAAEAVRSKQTGNEVKANLLFQDARKLEDTLAKQAAAPGRMLVADDLPLTAIGRPWPGEARSGRPSDPPPRPTEHRVEASFQAGMTGPPPPVALPAMLAPKILQPPTPVLAGAAAASSYPPRRAETPTVRSGATVRVRRPPPSLLDQKLWGIRISTAIAFVAAFVLAVVLAILFFSR